MAAMKPAEACGVSLELPVDQGAFPRLAEALMNEEEVHPHQHQGYPDHHLDFLLQDKHICWLMQRNRRQYVLINCLRIQVHWEASQRDIPGLG